MPTAPIVRHDPASHARISRHVRVSRQYVRSQRTRAESLHDGRALLRHLVLAAVSLGIVVYAGIAAGMM